MSEGKQNWIISTSMETFRQDVIDQSMERPVVVDLLRVSADQPRQFDLPLHYNGHLIEIGPQLSQNLGERPVLGRDFGYQHIWVDATATPDPARAFVTWQTGDRFYTWRWVPQPLLPPTTPPQRPPTCGARC